MFRDLNTILGLGILMFLCVATLYVVARSVKSPGKNFLRNVVRRWQTCDRFPV